MRVRVIGTLPVVLMAAATLVYAQKVATDSSYGAASATSTLSSKPSKNTAKLDKALRKMFER